MRCLLYARVSQDPRGQGRSVTEQETELRAWAAREGWDVAHVIAETGSASRYARSTSARQRWDDVTAAVATHDYDALLVWEASRATRDLTAYAQLRDLCATHGVSYGYSGTLYDLTSRSDRFRTGLDALLSEDESARTSERILRNVRARAAEGAPHGKLPYGYRREYDPGTGALLRQVPDETTAPIVAEMYARLAHGDTCAGIARDFTDRGIAPPRPPRSDRREAQTWLGTTVRRIALSPTNIGRRTHRGVVVGPAAWDPIVDETLFDTVTALLTDPTRLTHHGSTPRHLLSGIARCGACGMPLRRLNNRTYDAYVCPRRGCHRVSRAIWKVDGHVTEVLLSLLESVDVAAPAPDSRPELQDALDELTALTTRLDAFADQAADGDIPPERLARIEARLGPKIVAARRRVRHLRTPAHLSEVDLDDPRGWWERLDLQQRRRHIDRLLTIRVLPAGRGRRTFDPALIEVTPNW